VQKLIIYIFTLACTVIFIQALIPTIESKGKVFDPVDADDYAVIQQQKESNEQARQTHLNQLQETASDQNESQHKKKQGYQGTFTYNS